MARRNQPQEDGYVECDDCGHPIEEHDRNGCTYTFDEHHCGCEQKWTQREIRECRRRHGLPARWNPNVY